MNEAIRGKREGKKWTRGRERGKGDAMNEKRVIRWPREVKEGGDR